MPVRTISISHEAASDLNEIMDYTIRSWGAAQAKRYVDSIRARYLRIRDFPQLGIDRSDLRPGLRCISVLEHQIFYVVQEERARIVRILHSREDAELVFANGSPDESASP